jgi:hypothetical protein
VRLKRRKRSSAMTRSSADSSAAFAHRQPMTDVTKATTNNSLNHS